MTQDTCAKRPSMSNYQMLATAIISYCRRSRGRLLVECAFFIFLLSGSIILYSLYFRVSCRESVPDWPPLIAITAPNPSLHQSSLHIDRAVASLVLVGWLGEIRGYGWEIRGEIRQHLAAHMHTRPSWETEPQI